MSLVVEITVRSSVQDTPTSIPGAAALVTRQSPGFKSNTPGAGADQVALHHAKTYHLAGATQVIDLQSLLDINGATISFAKVRSVLLVNRSAVDGQDCLLGYPATTANAWTGLVSNPGQIAVKPSSPSNSGTMLLLAPNASGFPVSPTSRLLQLDPGAATMDVDLEIVGS
jgi:hypothetical protein